MTADPIQAAKERLTQTAASVRIMAKSLKADAIEAANGSADKVQYFPEARADWAKAEAMEQRAADYDTLLHALDDALHDYGNAESEAKSAEADNEDLKAALAEARRQIAERDEALNSIATRAELLQPLTGPSETSRMYNNGLYFALEMGKTASACLSAPSEPATQEEGEA